MMFDYQYGGKDRWQLGDPDDDRMVSQVTVFHLAERQDRTWDPVQYQTASVFSV